jgi:hypothetical protein
MLRNVDKTEIQHTARRKTFRNNNKAGSSSTKIMIIIPDEVTLFKGKVFLSGFTMPFKQSSELKSSCLVTFQDMFLGTSGLTFKWAS